MSKKQIQMPQYPKPYWRDSVELPDFPRLTNSIKVDVGIVGGGITGITAAYLLSKQGVKVALIDAGVLLNGTTGHTSAKITAQHGLIYDEFIQHFGLEKASLYYQANMEARKMIEETIKTYNIDCDFETEDAYIYTNSDEYVEKIKNEQQAYEQLEIDHELLEEIPLNIPVKLALKMNDQAQFHPLKYLSVLVDKCLENDVEFYENTTAVDVEYVKHPAIVTRNGERITCRKVISASHYPFYDGKGFFPTRMYADRSYVIAIKSPNNYPGGMYINAESPTKSIRTTKYNGEDLWLIGGEDHKTGQSEITTIKHYEALQTFAENTFQANEFLYRWSAQDLVTLDKLPYIGPITKYQDSVFVATGYRKWGMTNGIIAGKILSDLIVNDENSSPYKELFTPSRFQADPAIRKFIEYNADVAKHLVKGKLEYTTKVKDLKTDEATITRINGKRTGVYRDQDDQLHMVDTTCTHLGCEVEWNSGENTWDCPCHGSRFSHTGEVIDGPAKEPLNKIKEK